MVKVRKNKGVALIDVVNHLMHFKQEMHSRFDAFEKKLSLRIDILDENFRAHCKGVDDLDFRVQDIEDTKFPRRLERTEKHLHLTNA